MRAGYRHLSVTVVIALTVAAVTGQAQWTTVGTGIEYREYTISGPNNLFVARMDRNNTAAYIESTIGQGRLSGGTETVRSQANRYDDAIGYWTQTWGTRNDVVVAINGSYYNTSTGVPFSGVIHSGWYAKRYDNVSGQSGFFWNLNRGAYIGECVTHVASKNFIQYATGSTHNIDGINVSRGSDQLIIYTPQYDDSTLTDNSGSEVLVELTRPMLLMPTPNYVVGYVREIRPNQGNTPIPFDHIVLSATGADASKLLANVSVGDEIHISQEIKNYERDCATPRALDWTKAYAAVSGNWVFLRDGVIQYGIDSSGLRHPRTAIGLNDNYVFFIVCDGRSTQSIGMTIDELAEFCKYTLGCTWACNQDGGGSSTMVVNGVVKNDPSDGSERAVSNGMVMCNLLPKVQSSAFPPGGVVKTTTSSNVRLGPGTNYAVLATVPANKLGDVLNHPLRGVWAKGFYWWKVDFEGTVGWVAESLLTLVSSGNAPYITQQPTDQTVPYGGNASFTVQAGGATPLSYQWQKDAVNLTDGGPYSGTTTPTLSVAGVTSAEQGAYRCVVINSYGSAISDAATLSIRKTVSDFDGDTDVDVEDFSYLQKCLGILNVSGTDPSCAAADIDGDGDVTRDDVIFFIDCLSGPEIPAPSFCVN